jgi:hypothetical protein
MLKDNIAELAQATAQMAAEADGRGLVRLGKMLEAARAQLQSAAEHPQASGGVRPPEPAQTGEANPMQFDASGVAIGRAPSSGPAQTGEANPGLDFVDRSGGPAMPAPNEPFPGAQTGEPNPTLG